MSVDWEVIKVVIANTRDNNGSAKHNFENGEIYIIIDKESR